ncbi:PheS-related mystery ligase SrmL [Micromonosporaceae bacterium Da 78-11]
MTIHLTPEVLAADLAVRDLTDPASGPHAVQLVVDEILAAVTGRYRTELVVDRGDRIVEVADNYDRLGYSADAAARDARYTRYVDDGHLLRSQTSALVPPALRRLRGSGRTEMVLACPGVVYRRDAVDRLHTGTPHQLDVWPLTAGPRPGLLTLVEAAVGAALPGRRWRTRGATHPYTVEGLEIEAYADGRWVEIGECGVAAAHVLPAGMSGLALGLGLDRIVMLRKGISDIRLLRSTDPRVAGQLLDLAPYRPVSAQPAARRDVSVAVPRGLTAEDVGDRVRDCLGPDAHLVEEVAIRSITAPEELPAAARERLGLRPGQVNALVRVVLRDLTGTIAVPQANELRDRIHAALHHWPGTGSTSASRKPVSASW